MDGEGIPGGDIMGGVNRLRRTMAGLGLVLAILVIGGCSSGPDTAESPSSDGSSTAGHVFDPAEWTVDDGLSAALVVGAEVSPDGSEVAYTVMRAQLADDRNEWTSEVFVAGAGGSDRRRIGEGLSGVNSPSWSPDGTSIAFLAPVEEGDLAGTQQVYSSPSDAGAVATLTALPTGVMGFEWAPQGDRIALLVADVTEPEPGPGGPGDDAQVVDVDPLRLNLWTLEATAGAAPARLTDGEYRIEGFAWSPDGASLAFTHSDAASPDGWHEDISIVDVATGGISPVADSKAAEMNPLFSPDGKTLAFIRGETPTTDFSAWRVELVPVPGTEGGVTKTLAATPNELPMVFAWSADAKSILFEEAVGTGHAIGALPVTGAAPVMYGSGEADLTGASLSDDGSTLGFSMQGFATPQEAYVAPLPTDGTLSPVRVSSENDDIAKMPVPKMEVVSWKSSDGITVEGILSYPMEYEAGVRYPMVLSVHGGPAEKFSESYFGQPDVYPYTVWAEKGYAVLRANPRGSGGYGGTFRAANVADWGGGPYGDLMSGVGKVIEMGVADPDRLAVVGWSYGGYMTANITTRTNRFKVAVVGAGPVNLVSQAGTSDLPEMVPAFMAAYPWENPGLYRDQSPVFSAGKVKTPTLILHGTDDTRVPYSQGQEWYAALRAQEVECQLIGYPRSGHIVREPHLMKDLQLRVLEWVDSHVSE
jgi:dipeptidyl aminopeptidase/acylaminoacyl peptidase